MPRRTTVSRHTSSRYGISADIPGTVGCRSQSIGPGGIVSLAASPAGRRPRRASRTRRDPAPPARTVPCRCARRTARRAAGIRCSHPPASRRRAGRIRACRCCRWRGYSPPGRWYSAISRSPTRTPLTCPFGHVCHACHPHPTRVRHISLSCHGSRLTCQPQRRRPRRRLPATAAGTYTAPLLRYWRRHADAASLVAGSVRCGLACLAPPALGAECDPRRAWLVAEEQGARATAAACAPSRLAAARSGRRALQYRGRSRPPCREHDGAGQRRQHAGGRLPDHRAANRHPDPQPARSRAHPGQADPRRRDRMDRCLAAGKGAAGR